MTSHLDSHTTTKIKQDILSDAKNKNGIPHDTYNVRGIAHACTNRKYNILMKRRLGQIFIFILEWVKGLVKNQDCTWPRLTQP